MCCIPCHIPALPCNFFVNVCSFFFPLTAVKIKETIKGTSSCLHERASGDEMDEQLLVACLMMGLDGTAPFFSFLCLKECNSCFVMRQTVLRERERASERQPGQVGRAAMPMARLSLFGPPRWRAAARRHPKALLVVGEGPLALARRLHGLPRAGIAARREQQGHWALFVLGHDWLAWFGSVQFRFIL